MTDETTEKERETIERDDNEERCAQRTGIIAGDDWYVSPAHLHYGVFKAVNEFIEKWPYLLAYADERDLQWAIRQST